MDSPLQGQMVHDDRRRELQRSLLGVRVRGFKDADLTKSQASEKGIWRLSDCATTYQYLLVLFASSPKLD